MRVVHWDELGQGVRREENRPVRDRGPTGGGTVDLAQVDQEGA